MVGGASLDPLRSPRQPRQSGQQRRRLQAPRSTPCPASLDAYRAQWLDSVPFPETREDRKLAQGAVCYRSRWNGTLVTTTRGRKSSAPLISSARWLWSRCCHHSPRDELRQDDGDVVIRMCRLELVDVFEQAVPSATGTATAGPRASCRRPTSPSPPHPFGRRRNRYPRRAPARRPTGCGRRRLACSTARWTPPIGTSTVLCCGAFRRFQPFSDNCTATC